MSSISPNTGPLEKQLLQLQKMAAVGQLAVGIAHDLGNMLSVILWQAGLMKCALAADHPLHKKILEIEKTILQSRDMVRQLLYFAGKQSIARQVIHLNPLISETTRMIVFLIGKKIDLQFIPASALWNIRFDRSQIGQILINLAVNARDAMPDGGVLTIATSNVQFDASDGVLSGDCKPGDYVLLAVRDSGIGMDKAMLGHIFEPLFTTKK